VQIHSVFKLKSKQVSAWGLGWVILVTCFVFVPGVVARGPKIIICILLI